MTHYDTLEISRKANPGAMFNAFDLACRMGASQRQARN